MNLKKLGLLKNNEKDFAYSCKVFFTGSIINVGVLKQFEEKKSTISPILIYLSCRETSIEWRYVL
ncbi:hypothetical protein, partial [Metabacillus sp. 22489]|uniref:hypothetical protein n=1 Tax=Metabacillus sp. 22489 TaxID=3453928 RepID=UPI003F858116